MRRFLWLIIPSTILFFTLNFLWKLSEKKLSLFFISKAQESVKATTNWNLEIDNLKINLAPPGLEVDQIKISPPKNIEWMKPVKIKNIKANLDFLNLLAGQIKFAIIRFNGINANLSVNEIPASKNSIEYLPVNEIFDALQVIPIKMLLVENIDLILKFNRDQIPINIHSDVLLQTSPQTIHFGLKGFASYTLESNTKQTFLNFKTNGSLNPKTLQIEAFNISTKNSKLGLQGEFINFSRVLKSPNFSGVTDMQIQAEEIPPWLTVLGFNKKVSIKGQLRSKGSFEIKKWNLPTYLSETEILNSEINDFKIGDAKGSIQLKNKTLTSSEIVLNHPSGKLNLTNFEWNLTQADIKGAIDLKSLDLQKLFNEIHLKRMPVELGINAQLKCLGNLLNNAKIECLGQVEGKKLIVQTQLQSKSPPIIVLDSFSGEGSVKIDANEVSYDTVVNLPHSKGHSHGIINYAKGFNIDFDTENFDFQDASPLAGLHIEGTGKLHGRTIGNSQSANLEIALSTQNFWFENFGLGSLEGKLAYKKGHLLIDSPKARLFSSPYMAQIDVDLINSQIKGLVESPEMLASDAALALSRRAPVPFEISGTGATRAQFEGPFQLGKLSYHFEGVLKKGSIQGETYDELKWDWLSKNGNVLIENNSIQKGNALITVNGKANPLGNLNLEVEGNALKLENSSFLSKFVKTLGGDVTFHMSINNHILKPDILLEGKIQHTTLGDSDLPDSKFVFETDSKGRVLNLDLMGHQLKMDLTLPYELKEQARLFLEIDKFDFTDFLSLILGSPLRNEYKSLLSMKMDIKSDNHNLFESSGSARIEDLYIARNEHFLRNNKPIFIIFEKGLATLKDFSIKGYQSELIANGERFDPAHLKINIGGTIDIRILQIFTPFLDDMSGPVKGQIQLTGSIQNPEVYGNLNLNDVALKIKSFPPLFDHINSHLEFSQKRITIDSIRGSLAGGSLIGDGTIILNGPKDVRVDVKAQLRNLQMEVPEHFQSSGSADIVFSGNWFPYLLSGTYRVNQAFIDKDFRAENSENNIRQSVYLPKNLANGGFDPVLLDLQILLDKKVEIKNPDISGFLTGQIQVKGPPQSPILIGAIKTLPQTQLFFRDKVFDVQSGLVKFNDPTELNPELYFTARSIVDKYEISLLLQGKSKSPQLSLTSQPPLVEQDIVSLLALGVTTQTLDSNIQSSQQAAQTGYQIGSAIISANPLNKEIKQSLGVDVKFSSGFDDTKNAMPRVTVSKDIIPRKLNASASSSFSENQHYDVRFQYLLNDRLSTVGTYEKSEGQDGSTSAGSNQSKTSIFGLDLEYKVEFK